MPCGADRCRRITSSKVGSPAAKPVWPKQAAKGTGQAALLPPFVMRIAWR
jgi:hypothetical protein